MAKHNNVTLNMLFGVPKPDGSTRPILKLSDKSGFGFSVNDRLDSNLCTVEYVQQKELIQTVKLMGPGAYLWAKDIKDGYNNVPIRYADIFNLGFEFAGKLYL
eukprot:115600_1